MKKCGLLILLVFSLGLFQLFGFDIEVIQTISLDQSSHIIQRAQGIAVTEDQWFFVLDYKARHIKLFHKSGKLEKIWSNQGFGPGEFAKPLLLEYRNRHLVVMDLGKRRIRILQRKHGMEFTEKAEFFCAGMGYDMKYLGDQILIAGSKTSKAGKFFELYLMNYKTNTFNYLLPIENKYGFDSLKEYENKYDTHIKALSNRNYCDMYNGSVYHVWAGNLRILKIDIQSKVQTAFGHNAGNYTPQKMTPKIIRDFMMKNPKSYLEDRKHSFITGIIAERRFAAVIYSNYETKKDGWQYYIQFYSHDGKFLGENILPEGINNDYYPFKCFYYSYETGTLYFLSQRSVNEGENQDDRYSIIKYKIN